jgi:glycosyltransferase involved in cell wall biosynthesis
MGTTTTKKRSRTIHRKATVIIPAYNAQTTIAKTLHSIASQTIADQLHVIIVDDCSDGYYYSIFNSFSKSLSIEYIRLEQNGGPGIARQVGLKHVKTPYVAFIDADDIYLDMMFFEGFVDYMDENPDVIMISAPFLERLENGGLFAHKDDLTWLHSKLYRVAYLQKHKITFSELRACEDVEFNQKIALTFKDGESIFYAKDRYEYLWEFSPNSITRNNDSEYGYYQGMIGGIDAKMRAYEHPGVNKKILHNTVINELFALYSHFTLMLNDRSDRTDWIGDVFEWMVKYYQGYVRHELQYIDKEKLGVMFNKRQTQNANHVIPTITFHKFIQLLEKGDLEA